MGIIKQGILGGFSGKVGAVVGSSWKGKAVMKAKPLSVSNPRTAGQVAQRSKMKNVGAFATLILATIIKPLWDRFAVQMSGYNAFIRKNITLFADTLPSVFADLVISSGKMAASVYESMVVDESNHKIVFGWVLDGGDGYKLDSDLVYVVAINVATSEVAVSSAVSVRSDNVATVTFEGAADASSDYHVYCAFKRADGTIVSNTLYHFYNGAQ